MKNNRQIWEHRRNNGTEKSIKEFNGYKSVQKILQAAWKEQVDLISGYIVDHNLLRPWTTE